MESKNERKMREISVDGLPVIGQGFFGTVYRLDDETIIKVYSHAATIEMIENEKKKARLAFIKGIPTAISFDIVRVGENYGAVFELINAKTMMDVIIEDPGRADEIIKMHVDLMKQVHETVIDDGILPKAKDRFMEYLDIIASYIDGDTLEKLKALISEIPDDDHLVHGDMQYKNVMMSDDAPMLIDMDNLCVGQPVFDMYGLYLTYKAFPEDDPENTMTFSGISNEMADHIWDTFLKMYLDTDDEEILKEYTDRIRIITYIRFLFIIVTSDIKNSELGALRIKHASEHLSALVSRVEHLV